MSARVLILAVVAVAAALPAWAGPIGLAVGAFGGVNLSRLDDPEVGGLLGAKARVTLPGGILAVEASYTRVSHENAEDVWAEGDPRVVLDQDGFDLYAVDVLIGGGGPGLIAWYLAAGINVKELSDLGGGSGFEPGAEVGLGVELGAPATGLSVEIRGAIVRLDWDEPGEGEFATLTGGLNYAF